MNYLYCILGPLIGAPFPDGGDVPRAVSKNYFQEVCPNRTIIDTEDVIEEKSRYDENVGSSYIFDKWVEKLNAIQDPCVEILQSSLQVFDIRYVYL